MAAYAMPGEPTAWGVDGATLRVTQAGFPRDSSADAFYTACEMGWTDTFGAIRRHLHQETRER